VERSQHQISAVERHLKSWDQLSESIQRRLDEYEQRIERYAEQYQINRRSLEGLEAFREQLVREQREFIELQRLAFDRQQSKLQEQETVQEKQIRDQGIEVEKQVNELNKVVKVSQVALETLSQQLQKQQPLLTLLLRIAEEDAITRANSARDWHARFEQLATEGE
jgi:chromosome segregation ATPase